LSIAAEECPVRFQTSAGAAEQPVTLAWADPGERQLVVALARREGRQTMNLRTMPGARLVVLRCAGGGLAGWAGMDIANDPHRPEVFSQFVYPSFRGRGLGALLEQVWWTWLDRCGAELAYMRMESDGNAALLAKRLRQPAYRLTSAEELGAPFVQGCCRCELFGAACGRQAYIAVDVARALASCLRHLPPLDLDALPLRIEGHARRPSQRLAA
jgi:hypothetical protein